MNLVANASTTIEAPRAKVWKALIDPEMIHQYMFGTNVASEWHEGSAITWKGEWQGRAYEDKGTIVLFDPQRRLEYTHFSPLQGRPDMPENYHRVSIELDDEGKGTRVSLSQDNNENEEERTRSEKNWMMMLDGLKKLLET